MPLDSLLPLLAAGALAFSVLTYVVLDGTDLGVGILFMANPGEEARHVMAFSILPIWDGNETWLVLGGGGLIAMFPAVYSIFFTATYIPLFVMLLALILRGVALEYRDGARNARRRRAYDLAFILGSTLATFAQGVLAGALLQGIPHDGSQYSGDGWDWLSGFSLFCGLALVAGYALLGACWLVWRTDGELQAKARRQARVLGLLTLLVAGAAIGWSGLVQPSLRDRWDDLPLLATWLGLLAALALGFWTVLGSRHDFLPLFMVLGAVVVLFAGLLASLHPTLIPPSLTLEQGASPRSSLGFMLIGFAGLIPFTLAYSTYGFWVFRGKVRPRGERSPD
ncbi:cytochrome d ubiquinol oxidase subunit II [Stutzerimonas nosocomialis]|uniref:cytochrome d ubiquinol oxidase subunit II n=1 Tax=Stutzerimonas nosocomialis TaxID=1056496 RepID=UPI00110884F2|nr:cytochrome d ubiquinol oxidase subunit II [Stutzerimonas nosocomialis]TLX56633.1 cytochrome d ubiquinol oxidase subunit II [Stutzerimonas nosocomialis]